MSAMLVLTGCSDMGASPESGGGYYGGTEDGENSAGQGQAGLLTAGEWCDLDNWDFWQELLTKKDYRGMPSYWNFYTDNRVAVQVATEDGSPVANAKVTIKRGGETIAAARTSNKGRAELWIGLNQYQPAAQTDYTTMVLEVNGETVDETVMPFEQGICEVTLPAAPATERSIEVAFMVDATGSMGDELEYLKTELVDVVSRVESTNPGASVLTAAVFYRDTGDDYLTRLSNFTSDVSATRNFIAAQSAVGGGDRPEAVHTALDKSLSELQWSDGTRTRILFVLLDAPPHYEDYIIRDIHSSITKAMAMGVRLIPIVASGIDKETEFLMRFMAIATNGTYVFITDHSGVGNTHLSPSVGEYTVEQLNDLMVRLINEYAE